MASKTSIANRALRHVRVNKTISSLDEGSVEAKTILSVWDDTVDGLFASANWNFALTAFTLSQTGVTPAGWTFEYRLPQDLGRLVRVAWSESGLWSARYAAYQYALGRSEAFGRVLWCDSSNAHVLYIQRELDNPGQWGPLFNTALSWALAVEIGPALGSLGEPTMQRLEQGAALTLAKAKAVESMEKAPVGWGGGSWVTARFGHRSPSDVDTGT